MLFVANTRYMSYVCVGTILNVGTEEMYQICDECTYNLQDVLGSYDSIVLSVSVCVFIITYKAEFSVAMDRTV
jgi:ABC-type polysaccharide transport system permease subunit